MQVNTLNEQVRELKLKSERKDDTVLREMREDVRDIKLTLEEKKSHQKDSFHITQNRFGETKPIAKPKPLNLPGPSNFTLQSEGTADASTADNTDPVSREQLILTDLRDKVITTSADEISQTNGRDNVQALEDIETEETDGNYAWTTVVRRRRKNVVMGTRKTESTLKGVASTRDLYVGRCQPSVSQEVLVQYIKETANVTPQACTVI